LKSEQHADARKGKMKKTLQILGLLIIVTALKAVAWIAEHGAPASLWPTTTADKIGCACVCALLISFVWCLAWYLFNRDGK
jgi:hypothetical protein